MDKVIEFIAIICDKTAMDKKHNKEKHQLFWLELK